MQLRALFGDRRYHATPGYESVTLVPVDAPGAPLVVAYSDPRLQLQPSWWRWHVTAREQLHPPIVSHESPAR